MRGAKVISLVLIAALILNATVLPAMAWRHINLIRKVVKSSENYLVQYRVDYYEGTKKYHGVVEIAKKTFRGRTSIVKKFHSPEFDAKNYYKIWIWARGVLKHALKIAPRLAGRTVPVIAIIPGKVCPTYGYKSSFPWSGKCPPSAL